LRCKLEQEFPLLLVDILSHLLVDWINVMSDWEREVELRGEELLFITQHVLSELDELIFEDGEHQRGSHPLELILSNKCLEAAAVDGLHLNVRVAAEDMVFQSQIVLVDLFTDLTCKQAISLRSYELLFFQTAIFLVPLQ
jgi:hypothetical protein